MDVSTTALGSWSPDFKSVATEPHVEADVETYLASDISTDGNSLNVTASGFVACSATTTPTTDGVDATSSGFENVRISFTLNQPAFVTLQASTTFSAYGEFATDRNVITFGTGDGTQGTQNVYYEYGDSEDGLGGTITVYPASGGFSMQLDAGTYFLQSLTQLGSGAGIGRR